MITTTLPEPTHTQWVITNPAAATHMVWGGAGFDVMNEKTPDVGAVSADSIRLSLAGRSGVIAGQDTLRGTDIQLQLVIVGPTALENTATHAAFWARGRELPIGELWRVRRTYNGRTLTTYGRPGEWAQDLTLLHAGLVRVTATFEVLAPYWLGAPATPVVVTGLEGGTTNYLRIPFTIPWSFLSEKDFATTFELDGGPVWPELTLTGPITAPRIILAGKELRLNATLGPEQTVTITTLPGLRAVTGPDGANWASAVHPSYARPEDLQLTPGDIQVLLAGTAVTSETSLTVSWATLEFGG